LRRRGSFFPQIAPTTLMAIEGHRITRQSAAGIFWPSAVGL
jgi:hypothetical protein